MLARLGVAVTILARKITSMFHPYLTLSVGMKLAAQALNKDVAKLSCCAA